MLKAIACLRHALANVVPPRCGQAETAQRSPPAGGYAIAQSYS
ncbi:hypothetical protein [Nostoc sp. FACHB-133]|nr:hypothetical protein [Nostoc sp. FACHB-133]